MIVTAGEAARSIGYVPDTTAAPHPATRPRQAALTKRRAVDFCRVATALCPAAPGGGQHAVPLGGSY
jgi:hypothetical protein